MSKADIFNMYRYLKDKRPSDYNSKVPAHFKNALGNSTNEARTPIYNPKRTRKPVYLNINNNNGGIKFPNFPELGTSVELTMDDVITSDSLYRGTPSYTQLITNKIDGTKSIAYIYSIKNINYLFAINTQTLFIYKINLNPFNLSTVSTLNMNNVTLNELKFEIAKDFKTLFIIRGEAHYKFNPDNTTITITTVDDFKNQSYINTIAWYSKPHFQTSITLNSHSLVFNNLTINTFNGYHSMYYMPGTSTRFPYINWTSNPVAPCKHFAVYNQGFFNYSENELYYCDVASKQITATLKNTKGYKLILSSPLTPHISSSSTTSVTSIVYQNNVKILRIIKDVSSSFPFSTISTNSIAILKNGEIYFDPGTQFWHSPIIQTFWMGNNDNLPYPQSCWLSLYYR